MKIDMSRVQRWWQQRAPRERWMLGLMTAAIAAFVLWYGVMLPVRQAADAAQLRHGRATLALLQAELQLAQLRTLDQRDIAPPVDAAALKAAVLASAQTAGLVHGSEQDLDLLRQSLAERGLALVPLDSQPVEAGLRSLVAVEPLR